MWWYSPGIGVRSTYCSQWRVSGREMSTWLSRLAGKLIWSLRHCCRRRAIVPTWQAVAACKNSNITDEPVVCEVSYLDTAYIILPLLRCFATSGRLGVNETFNKMGRFPPPTGDQKDSNPRKQCIYYSS